MCESRPQWGLGYIVANLPYTWGEPIFKGIIMRLRRTTADEKRMV